MKWTLIIMLLPSSLMADSRWTSPFVVTGTTNAFSSPQVFTSSVTFSTSATVGGNVVLNGSGGSGGVYASSISAFSSLFANAYNPGALLTLGPLPNVPTLYAGLWLAQANPNSSNYLLLGGGNQSFINVNSGGTSDIEFRVANVTKFSVGDNGVSINDTSNVSPPYAFSVNNTAKTRNLMTVLDGGNTGIGTTNPTSLLDVLSGSVTVRDVNGTGGGVSASSYTVKGTALVSSTWTVRGFDGSVIKITTGSVAANTSIQITAVNMNLTSILWVMCSEVENVNTAGTSVRPKSLTGLPNSFNVYNADLVNMKDFSCLVVGKP